MADAQIPIGLSDLQLARLALKNSKAKEMFFRRVYPRISQVARFVVGDRKRSDDIAQVAAIEVLQSLSSFVGTGSIEAWAGRIAYRTALRECKKQQQIEQMFSLRLDDVVKDSETNEERRRGEKKLVVPADLITQLLELGVSGAF